VNCAQDDDLYDRIALVHKKEKQYLQQVKGRIDRRSIFDDHQNEIFFKQLFRNNNCVLILFLETQAKEIIAYQICYWYKNKLYGWNTGYDPNYAKYGVFDVLMQESIRHIKSWEHVDELDLGAGSYSWKFRWTSQCRALYSLLMWNSTKKNAKWYQKMSRYKLVMKLLRNQSLAK
jgi:CelD/BcsL family acetyltransferase involved in cellulose biosynthesis